MVTNTLIGTDDDLGGTLATYVFDRRLARSLLVASGLTLVGSLAAGVALRTGDFLGTGLVASTLVPILVIAVAVFAGWGIAISSSRLGRSGDLFVVHRFGLARHHGGKVTHLRWVDIASVAHTGSNQRSKIARWIGTDYVCRIVRRDGTATTFDNYIVDAEVLGHDVERRSLL